MRFDFARINHILIPQSKRDRDRFRRGAFGRTLGPIFGIWLALTTEGQTFFVLALVVGGFALDVKTTEVYVLFSALAGAIYASLVVSRFLRIGGVRAVATAPRRVTVGEEITFSLAFANDGVRARSALRVSGPFLPWDGTWTARERFVDELAPGGRARVEWRARFVQRGEHHLDAFAVGALAPLGLATGPVIETSGAKFLVTPKLANVTRIAMPIGRRHQPGGVALASSSGESMDLLGVRAYRPGDRVRDLHARGWARAGYPVVREYQQEYFSRVGVVLDTDCKDARKLEAGISLAAGVVAHLSRGEALIDLLVVGDSVHDLTLGRSLGFLEQALDLLACVTRGPPLSPESLEARLAPHLPRLSTVVLVALAGDAARASLAERIRARGTACVLVLVDDAIVRAIEAGDEVAL
jgi:uncharacterized protein (DUF58 family)